MNQRKAAAGVGAARGLLDPGTWDQLRLTWRLCRDPRVAPKLKTAVPLLTLLYVLSPVDLLPDVFLGLGQVDDIGVIGLALLVLTRLVPRLAPSHVVEEHMTAMGLTNQASKKTGLRQDQDVMDATYRVREGWKRDSDRAGSGRGTA